VREQERARKSESARKRDARGSKNATERERAWTKMKERMQKCIRVLEKE